MSERGMSADVKTETSEEKCRPCHLVSIAFSDATVYFCDSYKTLTFDGHDYTALGHFLGFGGIDESSELVVSSVDISLSGIDQTMVAAFLSSDYLNRTLRVYKAFLDSDEALIVDPVLIFEGRMDQPVIAENPDDGTCTASISATNQWSDFKRTPGRHTNHEEQQIWFPGDKGFAFASEVVKDIKWGRG